MEGGTQGNGRRGEDAPQAWGPRPSPKEIHPAALSLLERYGGSILATARRYSATSEDAEDAYQRGLEILLTKAPSTSESDLLPWLRTVVKHEALAIRKQRDRSGIPDEGEMERTPAADASTDEQVERYERLQLGAEALGRLKPQEIRCLLLRAEGYSYKQICEETGWTYTKVNRCLTEGRRSFLNRLKNIESGAECERLAPLLSLLADGEATAEDMASLRPHLRGCGACRATLREFRAAPKRVAALVPPMLLLGAGDSPSTLSRSLEPVLFWWHERAASLSLKVHQALEVATWPKTAAVAASTAALAGGGLATMSLKGSESGTRRAGEARQVTRDDSSQAAGSLRAGGKVTARARARRAKRRRARAAARAASRRASTPPQLASSYRTQSGSYTPSFARSRANREGASDSSEDRGGSSPSPTQRSNGSGSGTPTRAKLPARTSPAPAAGSEFSFER